MKTLSIAVLVKDEELYLAEFLEFHLLQGVEHFYLRFHQNITEAYDKTLDAFSEYLTYDVTFKDKPQLPFFSDVLRLYGDKNEWIAFIDTDEFLYSAEGRKLTDTLDVLPKNCGAYAVHWVLYGSNGEKVYRPELVTKRFTRRATDVNSHVKSIVRPSLVKSVGGNPHYFLLKPGVFACRGYDTLTHLPKEYARLSKGVIEPLRINHYHTKSYEEYKKRKLNPCSSSGNPYSKERVEEMFQVHDLNEIEDNTAAIYGDEVKRRLIERGLFSD